MQRRLFAARTERQTTLIIGMDFGTTNSGMAHYDGRHLELIPLDRANENPRVARSALYITNQRRVYMGREAIEKYYEQNINRKVRYQRVWVGEIALSFAELPEFVRDVSVEKDVYAPGRLFLSFKTGLRSSSYLGTTVGPHFYFLEDIVALYLYITRLRAEEHLRQDVRRIVLGRPVHFATDAEGDQLAEQRLVHAAFRAGYEDVYLQYEPIAAAYFYETSIDRPQHALIFDFGGGTLDITVARLGDPAGRAILANGGIPIAGDIFDQKLVRHKLPRHFGEGSHYIGPRGERLPVPVNFFASFADWQEMLELNKPDILESLERMQETSDQRRRLQMLIDLIRSSYSLKMFDAIEAAKRELSTLTNALVELDGPGFRIKDLVTRTAFERLIAAETEAIAGVLDDVVAQSGLRHDQIDVVIRTGGSAQIPAFIDLLARRFGADRVRAIDTFSSVTSGLGILGHHLATDQADLRHYRRADWHYGSAMREGGRQGIPPVDLDLMKRFIDVEENQPDADRAQVALLTVLPDSRVVATTQPLRTLGADAELALDTLGMAGLRPGIAASAPPADWLLLMTSEYRFIRRTAQELADLAMVDLTLAELEGFLEDAFGKETLSAIGYWNDLLRAEMMLLVSSGGEGKAMRAELLLPSLDQLHPYQFARLAGHPVALVPADADRALLLLTSSGGVARLVPGTLQAGAQRLLKLRTREDVVAALSLPPAGELLLAAPNGYGVRLAVDAVPSVSAAGRNGSRGNGAQATLALGRRALRACTPLLPGAALWALTTRRLCRIDPGDLPLAEPGAATPQRLLRLRKGEELVALHALPTPD